MIVSFAKLMDFFLINMHTFKTLDLNQFEVIKLNRITSKIN